MAAATIVKRLTVFCLATLFGYWLLVGNALIFPDTDNYKTVNRPVDFGRHVCTSILQRETASSTCIRSRTKHPFQICIHPPTTDKYVSAAIAKDGVYEIQLLNKLAAVMMEAKKPVVLVDIGANIGMHVLHIASLGFQVIAVEPSPEHLVLLCRSIALNRYGLNLVPLVVPFAVSSRRRNTTLVRSRDNGGHSYIVNDDSALLPDEQNNTQFHIGTIVLDDLQPLVPYVRDAQWQMVMKIDVEGHECEVLRNAQLFLRRNSVTYIFMEWMNAHTATTDCIRQMVHVLLRNRYTPLTMSGIEIESGRLAAKKARLRDVVWKRSTGV